MLKLKIKKMLKMFCNHIYGEINEKGFQFCKKCNKSVFVGAPECDHKWHEINTITITNKIFNTTPHLIYIQKCEHCGILNNHSTKK